MEVRSKYATYPEYHTSFDNLDYISPAGLQIGYNVVRKAIECFEYNFYTRSLILCEHQMGKRGLYPTLSSKNSRIKVRNMMNLIAYSDGSKSLVEICESLIDKGFVIRDEEDRPTLYSATPPIDAMQNVKERYFDDANKKVKNLLDVLNPI